MYRVLIVEDEAAEKDVLEGHLSRYGRERGEEFQTLWFPTALDFIQSESTGDLVLMDIDLPGVNGMEAAQLMREHDEVTPIIFVTNLAQYAVKGYEVDALDFVVKPVGYHSFALRMDRALRVMRRNARRTIALPAAEGTRILSLARIVFVEVCDHELAFHQTDGNVLRVRGSLSRLEERIGEAPFVRVSSSCLANMAEINLIRGGAIVMSTGDTLYFSRSRRKDALRAITEYWSNVR